MEAAQGQPVRAPRRHDDPGGLPPRAEGSELVDLRWDQIEFRTANLHVRRVEAGHCPAPVALAMNCAPCGAAA